MRIWNLKSDRLIWIALLWDRTCPSRPYFDYLTVQYRKRKLNGFSGNDLRFHKLRFFIFSFRSVDCWSDCFYVWNHWVQLRDNCIRIEYGDLFNGFPCPCIMCFHTRGHIPYWDHISQTGTITRATNNSTHPKNEIIKYGKKYHSDISRSIHKLLYRKGRRLFIFIS